MERTDSQRWQDIYTNTFGYDGFVLDFNQDHVARFIIDSLLADSLLADCYAENQQEERHAPFVLI